MTEKALEISGLKKTYKGGVEALKGIDLSVEQGDFFALLGPNGAGKSTTIGIITSLINKTSGTVKVFGHDIDENFSAAKSCLGVVPQEFNFSIFEKVHDIIMNQAGFYGVPHHVAQQRTEKYLRQLDLWEKRHAIARELSGGMKRRLMIARALIHEPRLLILDEPTAGVDIEIRRSMWDFITEINENGTTVILTTHYLEEAESLCRNIAIIDGGLIAEHSSMQNLLQKLCVETVVLNPTQPLDTAPIISGYTTRLRDSLTLEVDIKREQGMTALFVELAKQHIEIASMRNKRNRLEELFIRLTRRETVTTEN